MHVPWRRTPLRHRDTWKSFKPKAIFIETIHAMCEAFILIMKSLCFNLIHVYFVYFGYVWRLHHKDSLNLLSNSKWVDIRNLCWKRSFLDNFWPESYSTHTTPFWLITKLFRWKSTFMGTTKGQNINYFSCYDIHNEFHLSILPHTHTHWDQRAAFPMKTSIHTQKGFHPLFLCNVEP